ncbi:MAG TPA: YpiB family protein [Bacillota bacterium]|nr:YpiB family protein [Bacillota bacterium]
MNHWVSVETKKAFLEWFLRNYRFRQTEARRILDYILSSPHLMKNLHFTEVIHPNEKNIEISTTCANSQPPFKYFKGSMGISYNVAEAYQYLLNNPKHDIYLLLHFRGKQLNYNYQRLVKGPTQEAMEAVEIKKWSERVIQHSLMESRLVELISLIDQSLVDGDKEGFLRLTDERRKVEQEIARLNKFEERK